MCRLCVLENGYSFTTCKNAMILQLYLQRYFLLFVFSFWDIFVVVTAGVFLLCVKIIFRRNYFCSIITDSVFTSWLQYIYYSHAAAHLHMQTGTKHVHNYGFDHNWFDQFEWIEEIKMRKTCISDDAINNQMNKCLNKCSLYYFSVSNGC